MTDIPIAVRSSVGVRIDCGPPSYKPFDHFAPVESKFCRIISFSPDGKFFIYGFSNVLKIIRTDIWNEVASIENTKPYFVTYSPTCKYLVTWEAFEKTLAKPEGSPNLNIYNLENGELVKNFVQKKQSNWEPKWSEDEKLFSRIVNTDVVFYEDHNFERIVTRIKSIKVASFTICPSAHYIVTHSPGNSGQPCFSRLFMYPKFELTDSLANKSSFQGDNIEYKWNSKGTHVLLLTTTEHDKTGKSYYGKQSLHFMGINGQSNSVVLSNDDSIYSVVWNPKGQEFCVVYGSMPAKVTIFNLKCEPIFELGTGPKNSLYYNPQGNILLVGGFGNLNGNIELWDVQNRKIIAKCDARDTTYLEWCPDGIHFLTATTSPRLRMGNCYKIWHHTGVLLFEKFFHSPEELYELKWKKFPLGTFKQPIISSQKIEGITSKQAQASTQAYKPPSARNRPAGVTFNLHDDPVPTRDKEVSKHALKQRKKREARKAKKLEEGENPEVIKVDVDIELQLTGDPEKDKKMKNIKKKLVAIAQLKAQLLQGKTLEVNQLSKIKSEEELLGELQQLQI